MKYLAFALVFVLLLSGCFLKNSDDPIILDNSDPLALAPDVSWAVIQDPYAAFRKNADWDAAVAGHCRRGEVYRVEGCRTVHSEESSEKWYSFSRGWLPVSAIIVCSNKLRAQTIAESLDRQ